MEAGLLNGILEKYNTSKFYIVFLKLGAANHLPQGIIALARLGASEERIEKFVNWYKTRLEEPTGPTAQIWETKDRDVEKLLGANKNFYQLLNYFTEKLEIDYNSDVDLLVRNEFDKLQNGMMQVALHGVIRLGYACAVKSARSVCEGLAYMYMTYEPLVTSEKANVIGRGEHELKYVLNMLRKDEDLIQYLSQENEEYFYKRACKMARLKGDVLLHYATLIKTPVLDLESDSMEAVRSLSKWVIDCAVDLYVSAEFKNDFYLLHGITASWSLYQVLQSYVDPEPAIGAIQTFLCCLLAAYLCEGCPEVSCPIEPETFKYTEWKDIVQATLEGAPDEHVYKLVQVVKDMSTETEDDEKQVLYKAATNEVISNKFFFWKSPQNSST